MLSRCYYCIVLHLAISIALQLRPIARDTEKKGRCEKDEDATIERMVDQTGGGRIFCRELSTPEKIIYIEPSATDTKRFRQSEHRKGRSEVAKGAEELGHQYSSAI